MPVLATKTVNSGHITGSHTVVSYTFGGCAISESVILNLDGADKKQAASPHSSCLPTGDTAHVIHTSQAGDDTIHSSSARPVN